MFKLNFKIALRNIWRNKMSSVINIGGLATGLAACLLLLLYVSYEWNFDRQTMDHANTYKLLMNGISSGGEVQSTAGSTTNVLAPMLKAGYPEVAAAARIDNLGDKLVAAGQNSFKQKGVFADPDLLNIFDYSFISGNRKKALSAPESVIISESMARLLFGTTAVLNRTIRFDDKINLKITGVIRNMTLNTSVYFDFLMPWSLDEKLTPWIKEPSWGNYNYQSVVRLVPGTDVIKFNQKIKDFVKKHVPDADVEPWLFSLSKLHLYDNFVRGKSTGGKIEEVQLFMGLAIGILLIACINFMNMATARSAQRAKEVGIKKTIGASRSSLVSQFLMESLIMTLLAAVLAVVLIEVSIPVFNRLLTTDLMVDYHNISIWAGILGVVLLTGFISGSYPAFYLSNFEPVQVMKKRNPGSGLLPFSLRQILVVGQFSFAIVLIIATAVIFRQLNYIKNRPVGYQVDQLVQLPQEGELYGKFDLLKAKLVRSGAVRAVMQSSGTMANPTSSFSGMSWEGSTPDDARFSFNQMAVTYDFIRTTGVKLIAGRDFSPDFASDSSGVLLSASAVKHMNLKDPVGQTVLYHGNKCQVVGVFQDFILGSPAFAENPLVVAYFKGWGGTVTLRLNPQHPVAENLATITRAIKDINPAYPVNLTFVDGLYAQKINAQRVLGILANLFGGLAIFISCLGLFGLAAYSAEQRTKEIGIRKVLGASVTSLMQMLSLSFLKMVLIAIFISTPAAIYLMNKWLEKFDFHTSISWTMIVLATAGTIFIALMTVSYQAFRAAKSNPVVALKSE